MKVLSAYDNVNLDDNNFDVNYENPDLASLWNLFFSPRKEPYKQRWLVKEIFKILFP